MLADPDFISMQYSNGFLHPISRFCTQKYRPENPTHLSSNFFRFLSQSARDKRLKMGIWGIFQVRWARFLNKKK